MSGQFTKVKVWSWKEWFTGNYSIQTDLDATEQQVRSWLGRQHRDFDPKSLTCQEMKVKNKKVRLQKL